MSFQALFPGGRTPAPLHNSLVINALPVLPAARRRVTRVEAASLTPNRPAANRPAGPKQRHCQVFDATCATLFQWRRRRLAGRRIGLRCHVRPQLS